MDAFEGMVNVVAKVITSYLIIIVLLNVGQLLWNKFSNRISSK